MNPLSTAVYSSGRAPNPILLCGEAPGELEFRFGRPFSGPSGDELEWYLSASDSPSSAKWWYKTNVVKTYLVGNPDPTPTLISFWRDHLEDEVTTCQPKLIIAVGRFAASWFLGYNYPDAHHLSMDSLHGLPFAVTICGIHAIVLPVYHPAFGLHNDDMKGQIAWDYASPHNRCNIAKVARDAQHMEREAFIAKYVQFTPHDAIGDRAQYVELSGPEFVSAITPYEDSTLRAPFELSIDTEGWVDYPWPQWLQITPEPGISYVLKSSRKGFSAATRLLQTYVNRGTTIIAHQAATPSGAMIDTQICRLLGLDLRDAILDDTMYAAYLLRVISRGLKPLAFRYAGTIRSDYESIIGDIGREKQIDYLRRTQKLNWPKPEPFPERQSDGTWKIKTVSSAGTLINNILRDIDSGKTLKSGEPTDPETRFKALLTKQRAIARAITQRMGAFPRGTLDDVDSATGIAYAGGDSDDTFRIKPPLLADLDSLGLIPIYRQAMRFLPIVEDMQREGMPAVKSKFDALQSHILRERAKLQREFNTLNDGKPINANSPKQMIPALLRRGIKPRKRTKKTGQYSIGKKSLEYAKHASRFVWLAFQIKEHGKIESTYCRPALRIAEDKGVGIATDEGKPTTSEFIVNSLFNPAQVTSRRLATKNPSLLNQPTRTRIGRMVRDCYVAPSNRIFAEWDFNAQELRVAAHLAQDRVLIDIFSHCQYCGHDPTEKSRCRKSEDGKHKIKNPHKQAAMRLFGLTREEDVKDLTHKLPAKTATFGVINGLSGPGLVDLFLMNIPPNADGTHPWAALSDCEKLIEEILSKVYRGIGQEIANTAHVLMRKGFIRDIFGEDAPGMIRYLPNGRARGERDRSEAVRQGFNHRVQGTAAQMSQAAAVYVDRKIRRLQRAGKDIHWHLLVHDSFLFSMPRDIHAEVAAIVLDGMENHHGVTLSVPVQADGEIAESWGGLKKD